MLSARKKNTYETALPCIRLLVHLTQEAHESSHTAETIFPSAYYRGSTHIHDFLYAKYRLTVSYCTSIIVTTTDKSLST